MRLTVLCVRTAVLVCTFCLSIFSSRAQSLSYGKVEIGVGLGPLIFLGDLGGNLGRGTTLVKDVNLPTTNLSKGLFLNFFPAEWLGFRFAANSGMLEGADSLINEKGGLEVYRKVRNLHFRSKLSEVYGAIELYPTVFFEQYEGLAKKLRPYGLIGLGVFKFNPQALYYEPNGSSRWVDLQPLRTEGQGMAEYPNRPLYKLTQLEVPMGLGVKYYFTESLSVGLEVLHRKTFTDYVDDLSTTYINPDLFDSYLSPENAVIAKQVYFRGATSMSRPNNGEMRGQKKNNDAFFSSILRFGWRIEREAPTPSNMRCPKF